MAKYKKVNYDQMEMIPLSFADQLLPGTFEHTVNYLVEEKLDLSVFDARFRNDATGAPAWNPKVMLKIILYCYSKGIVSSREIENACRVNVIAKSLSANSVPHFTVIADFVSSMKAEIYPIFLNILMVCSEMDLLGGGLFAMDGCKLPSNASKEWSGTFDDLKKKKYKLEKLAQDLVEKHERNDRKDDNPAARREKELAQIERIRKKADRIGRFLENEEPKPGTRYNEIQSNVTDNESAKIKSSKGIIQGYNGIAVVDEKRQVVVYPEAYGSGAEGGFLKRMVRKSRVALRGTGIDLKGKTVTADTNYFSESNLKYLSENGMRPVIPDQQFRKRDVRFKNRDRFRPAKKDQTARNEFRFDKKKNRYGCPDGRILKFKYNYKIKNITYAKYDADERDCQRCRHKERCLRKSTTRARTLSRPIQVDNRNYSEEMKNFIDTEEGRDLYAKRMATVEPVFGNITYCKGMRRFTLRSKAKVNIQWVLFNIVHNIGKIQKFGKVPEK